MSASRVPYNPSPPPPALPIASPTSQFGNRPRAPRPPRIQIHGNGSYMGSMPPTSQIPFTAQSNPTIIGSQGQPYWPAYANPFAAGNFMSKGFEGFVDFTKSGMSFGEKFTYGLYVKFSKWSKKWFTHIFLFLVVLLYCVGGAMLFQAVEEKYVQKKFNDTHALQKDLFKAVQNLSRDLETRNYHPDEFNGKLILVLRTHKDAVLSFINTMKTLEELEKFENPWHFWNAMFYCGTIFTTIGYGHITPQTVLGRSLTVIYAIIGIPLFLILLADFGKLFTRAIKFVWAYVRRIYYTGTCRKVRKQQQVMDVISGFNTMYDYAVKRPSHFFGNPNDEEAAQPGTPSEQQPSEHQPPIMLNQLYATPQTPGSHVPSHLETPTTPYPETFEVDDEFNLPISLASVILVSYIVIGAFVYTIWEDWTYFEAFYFVFISMSTIGFGDFVPNHPIFMMCSILYLIFGLALTSMFINVVQIKLTDTFREASAKITATIGLNMAGGSDSILPTPTEIASVHIPRLGTIGEAMDEELSPNDVINLPPSKFTPDEGGNRPPPLLPKKGAAYPEPAEEKPKKKKGFFGK